MRVGPVKIFRNIDIFLRPAAKAEAEKIVMRRYGLLDLEDREREEEGSREYSERLGSRT